LLERLLQEAIAALLASSVYLPSLRAARGAKTQAEEHWRKIDDARE
jgi:hypothetical protein